MLGFAKDTWKIAKCRVIQATSESLNTVESTMRPNMRDTISYVSLVVKFVVRYKAIELHTKQDTWAGVNLHCRVANLRKVAWEVFGNSYRAFNR